MRLVHTTAVKTRYGALIVAQCTFEAAAAAVGISRQTLYNWQKTRPDFALHLTRARDEAEMHLLTRALAGGKGSSAAQWVLERRFWQAYGRRERVELSGDSERPLAIDAVQRLELVVKRVIDVPALAADLDRELERRDGEPHGLS